MFENSEHEPRAEVYAVKERPLLISLPGELASPDDAVIVGLREFSLHIAAAFFEGLGKPAAAGTS